MKLIREKVFETNSSSAHSISIASKDKMVLDTILPDENGRIELTGGDFGWDYFKHNDALTKANYAAQDHTNPELLIKIIKKQTGAKEVIIQPNGYIDHESLDTLPKDEESLYNFIFNKNSWLFGGNDNSEPNPEFYVVPEYNSDGTIKKPNFKYVLRIDDLEKTTRFLNYPSEDQMIDAIYSMLEGKCIFKNKFESINYYFNDGRFELNYEKQPDLNNKVIYLVKEPNENEMRINGYKKDEKYNYSKQRRFIKELWDQPNSPFVKVIKFHIDEI